MTVKEAIAQARLAAPDTIEDESFLIWLSRLDGQVKAEILDNYEGETVDFTGYNSDTDSNTASQDETVLLVPAPYDEMYVRYLEAQIYRYLGEINKYNNCITEFNVIFKRYKAQYAHEHMPKGAHRYRFYGG